MLSSQAARESICQHLSLMPALVFSCVIQLQQAASAGNWSIIDHLFLPTSSSSSASSCTSPPLVRIWSSIFLSCIRCVHFKPRFTQSRALVLTTCNCIVRIVLVKSGYDDTTCIDTTCIVCIVLVKSGDDDIHVVVVWTFTPGDDWSVVSATASVIGLDASDTYGN